MPTQQNVPIELPNCIRSLFALAPLLHLTQLGVHPTSPHRHDYRQDGADFLVGDPFLLLLGEV